jgi:LmbE family N-acetylglucosaminyl deacetylase
MIGRREFVGFGGAFVASAGLTANTKVPPKDFSQQRSMESLANIDIKDMRIMVIGAHPDDADLTCGCTAISFAKRGARVKFVSVTNGDKGHQTMTPPELARRRKKETEVSAKRFGIEEYIVMGCPDCELEPTLEWRKKMIRMIREFSPHIIFTHRTCDYHADHRATGQLVMDATYLLVVPNFCPETPEAKVYPAVFFLRDKFTVPRIMRPDVAVNSAPMIDQWAEAVSSHESQFFEWLPRENKTRSEVNPGANAPMSVKKEYIKRFWAQRKFVDAKRFNLPFEQAEVFEMSEYGKQLTREEMLAIFPEGSIIPDRTVDKNKV